MRRKTTFPRQNWQTQLHNVGFTFHTDPTGPYWDESVYYEFTKEEIQAIERATSELYQMTLKAVEKVVHDKNLLKLFCGTDELCEYVAASWRNQEPTLYGRFDFSFEEGTPKLLEFNADTPTSLVEASVAQWFWFQDKFGKGPESEMYDQFNSLHQNLIDQWKTLAGLLAIKPTIPSPTIFPQPPTTPSDTTSQPFAIPSPSPSTFSQPSTIPSQPPTIPPDTTASQPSTIPLQPTTTPSNPTSLPFTIPSQPPTTPSTISSQSVTPQTTAPLQTTPTHTSTKVHFSCVSAHEEDFRTLNYLVDVALQAGIEATSIFINDIGWNKEKSRFVDLKEEPITHLFKLYPWEWLTTEGFSKELLHEKHNMRIIEPAWKMILSNKNILPILWEMFPNHPNLLPCYFERDMHKLEGKYVKKPVLGREGNNVSIVMGAEGVKWKTEGDYGNAGYIYQQVCLIPEFEGNRALVGSWIVGDKSSGIGIREDNDPITKDESRFVPHVYLTGNQPNT